ncbi:MAG: YjbH domain-containing protein [Chlorobi bacterium]|nr:YjbH domain-containing protein [Chlorobiota bacterium]
MDMPTAGILPDGSYSVDVLAFNNGGITTTVQAAPFSWFNVGLSFGGTDIIGQGIIDWQGLPGFHAKIRILNETLTMPALVLGLDTQGKGKYLVSVKRYQTQSAGVFLAASKNFRWKFGSVAVHGGMNYSFEPVPSNRFLNFWGGAEQSLGKNASINLEFNPTLDDDSQTKGLLNLGLRWSLAYGLTIQFQVRDILENKTGSIGSDRTLGLEYISFF